MAKLGENAPVYEEEQHRGPAPLYSYPETDLASGISS